MKKSILLFISLLIISGCSSEIETVFQNHSGPEKRTVLGENVVKFKGYPNEPKGTETKIPILMYHYVRTIDKEADLLGYNLSIDPDTFGQQLKWLKNNDYKTLTTKNIIDDNVYKKSVIMIFDDGYHDFYTEAFPHLKEYNYTATVAIIVDQINTNGYLSENEIEELESYGIEIISHTMSHPDLTKLDDQSIKNELENSKSYLENKFKGRVNALVYPYGKFDDNVIKKAREAGYVLGITTEPGIVDLKDNHFKLNRIRVDNRDGLAGFIKKMELYN
jgi:peptidoglycan/xylan/chitin deacetylase (PgdA/CDA1 family)